MSDNYEFAESLGARHPVEVSLTVAQAEERERSGIPLPMSGDPETDHARELLAIGRARRQKMAAAPVVETETAFTGGLLVSSSGMSFGEGLNFCVGSQKGPAVISGALDAEWNSRPKNELERAGHVLDRKQERFPGVDLCHDLLHNVPIERVAREIDYLAAVDELKQETSPSVGAPPGALHDNSNPTEGDHHNHEALTDSITALAATQRRLMIGGRLAVRS